VKEVLTVRPLLAEAEVSKQLNISLPTLRRWRMLKQGPPYRKLGASLVRYAPEDIDLWLEGAKAR
jgi:predicted DNA-binding transcriptional regulator AlpA